MRADPITNADNPLVSGRTALARLDLRPKDDVVDGDAMAMTGFA